MSPKLPFTNALTAVARVEKDNIVSRLDTLAKALTRVRAETRPGEKPSIVLVEILLAAATCGAGEYMIYDWLEFNKSVEFAKAFRGRFDELRELARKCGQKKDRNNAAMMFHMSKVLIVGYLRDLGRMFKDRSNAERAAANQPARDSSATVTESEAVIQSVRLAIANTPGGKTAKVTTIITAAKVNEGDGRRALRKLEELGEYSGFARPTPAKFRR